MTFFYQVSYFGECMVDEVQKKVTVLPPGEWDPSIRIEPPTSLPSQVPAHSHSNIDSHDGNILFGER